MRLSDPSADWSRSFCGATGPAVSAPKRLQSPPPRTPANLAQLFPGRLSISTIEAAAVLGFKEQTLRKWSHDQSGPIQPQRIGRRLAWLLADLAKLVERS
jgi:hypothetical protein